MNNIAIFLRLRFTLSCLSLRNVDRGALPYMCTDILKTIIQDICSHGISHAYNDNVIYIRIAWNSI